MKDEKTHKLVPFLKTIYYDVQCKNKFPASVDQRDSYFGGDSCRPAWRRKQQQRITRSNPGDNPLSARDWYHQALTGFPQVPHQQINYFQAGRMLGEHAMATSYMIANTLQGSFYFLKGMHKNILQCRLCFSRRTDGLGLKQVFFQSDWQWSPSGNVFCTVPFIWTRKVFYHFRFPGLGFEGKSLSSEQYFFHFLGKGLGSVVKEQQ